MVYDFGAVAVIYAVPIEGPFAILLALSEELYDNESLLADSRLQVDQFLHLIGDAAAQPHLSPVVEDYVIFHIESFAQAVDPNRFCAEHGRRIAQILRAERHTLVRPGSRRRAGGAHLLQCSGHHDHRLERGAGDRPRR